jgi:hypothetical protein
MMGSVSLSVDVCMVDQYYYLGPSLLKASWVGSISTIRQTKHYDLNYFYDTSKMSVSQVILPESLMLHPFP